MSSDETGEEVFEPAPDEPSQVAELDTSRSAKVAKAWWLIEHQGMSFEAAAKELNVSKNTAWRMCNEGRAQVALLPWLKREDMRTSQLIQLRAMRSWLYADAAAEGGKALDYVPVLLKVMEREQSIGGTTAPIEHLVRGSIGPDPEFIAALEATMNEDHEGTQP